MGGWMELISTMIQTPGIVPLWCHTYEFTPMMNGAVFVCLCLDQKHRNHVGPPAQFDLAFACPKLCLLFKTKLADAPRGKDCLCPAAC